MRESIYLHSNGNVSIFDGEGQQVGSRVNMIRLALEGLEREGIDLSKVTQIRTVVNGIDKYVIPIRDEAGEIVNLRFAEY